MCFSEILDLLDSHICYSDFSVILASVCVWRSISIGLYLDCWMFSAFESRCVVLKKFSEKSVSCSKCHEKTKKSVTRKRKTEKIFICHSGEV